MSPTDMSALNLPIIELNGVIKEIYPDGSGNYHYEVGYLMLINGNDEMVLNCYPVHKKQLLALPMIDEQTQISVMLQIGSSLVFDHYETVATQL